MLASSLIATARSLLQDADQTRWPDALLLGFLNQGRRMLVKAVPTRFRQRRAVQLVPGAKQSVPNDCAFLFAVARNLGTDGSTQGASIRQVDRSALEIMAPRWTADSGGEVKEYAQDVGDEPTYMVNPPVPGSPSVWVELELAAFPAALTTTAQDVGMSDRHEQALVYWMLHQAHQMETEEGSAAKSELYFKGFQSEASS